MDLGDKFQSSVSPAARSSRPKRSTYKSSAPPGFSGEFVRIDPDAKFYDDQQVEGIHLLTDFDNTREIQIRLGTFALGSTDFFPAMWPIELNATNLHKISKESYPYVVAPQPAGTRYMFYIDSAGDAYLENMTQHIFYVDKDHAFQLCNSFGHPIFDTVLFGMMTREKLVDSSDDCQGADAEKTGKLTFVIYDAIRCNGTDLVDLPILDRINFITEEIIKPRIEALEKSPLTSTNEVFNLDIVEYKLVSTADDYLSEDFDHHFQYPLYCLVFLPLRQWYIHGTCKNVFRWKENELSVFVYRLRIPTGSENLKEAELCVIGPKGAEIPFASMVLTDELRKLDGCIIDCQYKNQQWVFIRVRKDRAHPNGLKVIDRKFLVVENPVSRDLLSRTILEKYKIPENNVTDVDRNDPLP